MASTQKRKQTALSLVYVMLIITITSSLILVFFPVPIRERMQDHVSDDIMIKQHQQDRWAQIPGKLGYKFKKVVKLMYPEEQKLEFDVQRTFQNLTYEPTESIVDYLTNFDFKNDQAEFSDSKNMSIYNLGGLSVWNQLNSQPDFLKAFHALYQVKNQLTNTNIYDRYFAYNLFRESYGNYDSARKNLLFGVSNETATAIYHDEKYGWFSPSKLYKWVRAMKDEIVYESILDHFRNKMQLKDFTKDTLDQLVGRQSLMFVHNTTFSFNVGNALGYTGYLVYPNDILSDQWSDRAMTKDATIPIYRLQNDTDLVSSIFDLYNDESLNLEDQFSILAGYQPELDYEMEEVLGFDQDDVQIDNRQANSLFALDVDSYQTLVSPVNLQFFFERYKQGNFDDIAKRFTVINKKVPLSNDFIRSLYKYLVKISDRQFDSGTFGNSTDYSSHSAFGSLMAINLKKSYQQIYTQMDEWLPTRVLAAYLDVNYKTCQDLVSIGITNDTRVSEICSTFKLDDPDFMHSLALAPKMDAAKQQLLSVTGMTAEEYSAVYDSSKEGSLAKLVVDTDSNIAITYGCKSQDACRSHELTLMQWLKGNITSIQPKDFPGNRFLFEKGSCVNGSFWNQKVYPQYKTMFECPEFIDKYQVTVDDEFAANIFDQTGRVSLDDEIRASIIVDFIMTNPESPTSTAKLSEIYGSQTNFYKFFDAQRLMVQEFLLGGKDLTNITLNELLYGYNDERISHIYDEMDYFGGKQIHLEPLIRPLFMEAQPEAKEEKVGIYTGSLKTERLGEVRFVNDKDYVNMKKTFNNGTGDVKLQVSPRIQQDLLVNATNGMQFPPQTGKDKDDLKVFSSTQVGIFSYKAKDASKNNGIDYQSYESTDQPLLVSTQMISGLNKSISITDNKMSIQPDTGLLMQSSQSQMHKLNIGSSGWNVEVELFQEETNIFLPMPSLDHMAGQQLKLAQIEESIQINQDQFSDEFDFVTVSNNKIKTVTTIFLITTVAGALGLAGSLFWYCKVKKEEE